jgi:leader peptidase (prepilin peptidase)/N-methyltransferase
MVDVNIFILSSLIFIFGTIIGSFLNVVILRHNTGESVIYSGSRCFSCGKRLSWYELIPIFSFLIQKGRCRKCKSRISWQYPIVEFITGLLFLAVAWKLGFQLEVGIPYYWLIFSLLIVISVYDLRHQIIPSVFVYFFIFLSFLNLFRISDFGFRISIVWSNLFAGIAFLAFFALFWLVSKGKWMGLGDAKLALGIGWSLGAIHGLIAMLFSFWAGALTGIFLLLFAGRKFTIKSRIPFGPFLVLGMMIAFLFGGNILQSYLNIFAQ